MGVIVVDITAQYTGTDVELVDIQFSEVVVEQLATNASKYGHGLKINRHVVTLPRNMRLRMYLATELDPELGQF